MERQRDVIGSARLRLVLYHRSVIAAGLTIWAVLSLGGTLVSSGAISVGDLTSLLLYTVYVGGGLQTLT